MTNHSPKPFPGCYWLLPGKLLAGELPVASGPQLLTQKIEALLDVGIQVFINLIQEKRFEYGEILQNVADRRGKEIEYIKYPIKDMYVPSISVVKEILNTIDQRIDANKPVYFHCYIGVGRTGVIAGCWLARHNQIKEKGVLDLLWKIRKEQDHKINYDSPQSYEQIKMVRNWKLGV